MRKSFDGVYFYIGKSLLQIVFVFYLLGTEPILINNLILELSIPVLSIIIGYLFYKENK